MKLTGIINKYLIYLLLIVFALFTFFLSQKVFLLEKDSEYLKKELSIRNTELQSLKTKLEEEIVTKREKEIIYIPPDYKKLVKEFIEKKAETFITEKHLVGGTWIVTDYRFLSPDLVLINYEDGHIAGQALLKIDYIEKKQVKAHIIWKLG